MECYSSLDKRRRGDTAAGDDQVASASSRSTNGPTSFDGEDELSGRLIYNSSRTAQHRREQRQENMEEEAAAQLLASLHTHVVASPVAHKPSSNNGHKLRKRKSRVSDSSNKEMESTPKKKRRENKSFEQRIEDLRAYKEKHGHVNVKKNDDKSLYEFCVKIKCARSNPEAGRRNLTTKDIASLDALGFDWSVRSREQGSKKGSKTFEQRMDDLQAYKEKHRHTNVKKNENKCLYQFCVDMRHARNNPEKSNWAINEERIASLDALGFDWAATARGAKSFEQRIEDLRAYKEKNGHVNVKKRDKTLYGFCSQIRHARKYPEKSTTLINEERIASLNALGFEWTVKERRAMKSFEQRIEDLRAYKEKNGHVNVKRSDDKSLYKFCCNIRHTHNNPEKSNMAINDDRIASLDALGFNWSVKEPAAKKSFEQRIEDLKAYKERHGHINVRKSEDRSLNEFCRQMRYTLNNPEKSTKIINDDRIASLDALGFDWSIQEKHANIRYQLS